MYICLILYYRHVNFYSGIDMYYSNQIKINHRVRMTTGGVMVCVTPMSMSCSVWLLILTC